MLGTINKAESMTWQQDGPAGITFQRAAGSGPAMLPPAVPFRRHAPRSTRLLLRSASRPSELRGSRTYRLKFSELPGGRNPFGFKDGLHNPRVEGSGTPIHPGYGPQIKAGEFIMGYPDQLGEISTSPEPEVLRRNGTFLAFRKFHTRVAEFRKYIKEQASSPGMPGRS